MHKLLLAFSKTSFRNKISSLAKEQTTNQIINYCNSFREATAALSISTIVLGVDNNNLRSELEQKENLVTTTTLTPTTTENPIDMSKYRLPTSVVPVSYDLYLYPDLNTGLFKGKVATETKVLSTTQNIVLNSNKLNITSVLIDEKSAKFELDEKYELLTVRKADGSDFEAKSVKMVVDFEGDMNNRIVGLYKSSYTNSEGNKR